MPSVNTLEKIGISFEHSPSTLLSFTTSKVKLVFRIAAQVLHFKTFPLFNRNFSMFFCLPNLFQQRGKGILESLFRVWRSFHEITTTMLLRRKDSTAFCFSLVGAFRSDLYVLSLLLLPTIFVAPFLGVISICKFSKLYCRMMYVSFFVHRRLCWWHKMKKYFTKRERLYTK